MLSTDVGEQMGNKVHNEDAMAAEDEKKTLFV